MNEAQNIRNALTTIAFHLPGQPSPESLAKRLGLTKKAGYVKPLSRRHIRWLISWADGVPVKTIARRSKVTSQAVRKAIEHARKATACNG